MSTPPAPITVVIPLYQKAPYIERALRSVHEQRRAAKAIIVVNDGSTDGGPEIVRRGFPEVVVIDQANAGVGAARNAGLELARTPWIAFLDADDHWTPHHVYELERLTTAFPEAGVVSTAWLRVMHGQEEPTPPASDGRLQLIDYFAEAASRGGPVWTSSAAIARRAYDALGGFGNARLGEDQEYWARIALRFPVAVSSARTAYYVRGVGSVTESAKGEAPRDIAPASPEEVLPVLATLSAALEDTHLGVPRSSIIAYWNAKLASKARESISRGEFARARALRGFLHEPVDPHLRRRLAPALLPPRLLRAGMRFKRAVR